MDLMVNSLLKGIIDHEEAVYRVLAIAPPHDALFLYRLRDATSSKTTERRIRRRPLSSILELLNSGVLQLVTLHFDRVRTESELTQEQNIRFIKRKEICFFLMQSDELRKILLRGLLNQTIVDLAKEYSESRANIYRYFNLLCEDGLYPESLIPKLDRCGAPGILRPCDNVRKKAGRKTNAEKLGVPHAVVQRGIDTSDHKILATNFMRTHKPGQSLRATYSKIIGSAYVELKRDRNAFVQVPPAQGTYPNLRQAYRVFNSQLGAIAIKRKSTTDGHYDRNHRGLHGKAYQFISGPGHRYEIDATWGDIYLRSSINRTWSIGRPIVYLLKCSYSGATIAFHVSLKSPSWREAALTIYAGAIGITAYAGLWGVKNDFPELSPRPSLPSDIYGDRGEPLSRYARDVAKALGMHELIAKPRQPGGKGTVEVGHRVLKDDQMENLPGAIDARRKEIELRKNPKDCSMTLQDYVAYLCSFVYKTNNSPNCEARLTAEMMTAGCAPTRAAIWSYGFSQMLGHRFDCPRERLDTVLLPSAIATVRSNGIFFMDLAYDSQYLRKHDWTGLARISGSWQVEIKYFPGNNTSIWWFDPDSKRYEQFDLAHAQKAPRGMSFEDWEDIQVAQSTWKATHAHGRVVADVCHQERSAEISANSKSRLQTATTVDTGNAVPSIREARAMEFGERKLSATPERNVHDTAHSALEKSFSTVFPAAPSLFEDQDE